MIQIGRIFLDRSAEIYYTELSKEKKSCLPTPQTQSVCLRQTALRAGVAAGSHTVKAFFSRAQKMHPCAWSPGLRRFDRNNLTSL